MKPLMNPIIYYIFTFALLFNQLFFTGRLKLWLSRAFTGKRYLHTMRPSNKRYGAILGLYRNALINSVCYMAICGVNLYLFFDCATSAIVSLI